jgi:prevent-host-death family protein
MPNDIISLTEFKSDASGWIERLQSQPPVVLTQNGRGRAVVLSLEAYRQIELEMALMGRLVAAKDDLAAGRTRSTAEVFASARQRLAARRKSAQKPSA